MGWMQELYQTYENCKSLAGRPDDTGHILLPIGHSTQNAQIEVAIDLEGDFKGAARIEKAQAVTIIPVTEDSGARGNGINPHPLHDKLCYVAGDYAAYFQKKNAENFYEAYIRQLEKWTQDPNCHDSVRAIYRYLQKGNLIADLIRTEVLATDENGRLLDGEKIEGIAQPEAFIRFRIQDIRTPGSGEIWKDPVIYDCYVKYCLTLQQRIDLDYISGEYVPCSDKQPSKIRHSADKAKLISANDTSGFTFRGRFAKKEEALSIGYEQSQKAHNALRWLLERQGYRAYGTAIVSWNVENRSVPAIWSGTEGFYNEESIPPDVGYNYGIRVAKAIEGKYADINTENRNIMVIALDAATPGRLSVTYYREMPGSDFLERLIHWHTTCAWFLDYKQKPERTKIPVLAPRPEEMAEAAYGVERGGNLSVDEKLMKDTLERLLPCIIDRQALPKDMVKAAVENASKPLAYSHYNRRRILAVACAMVNKQILDETGKEERNMELDKECCDRSYLYGRLLAVAHKLEYDTYDEKDRKKRETNATRYTSALVRNPYQTWSKIHEHIRPYWKKLNLGQQIRYEKLFEDIHSNFDISEYEMVRPLNGKYLLGYYCQLKDLYTGKKDQEEEKEKENENEQVYEQD